MVFLLSILTTISDTSSTDGGGITLHGYVKSIRDSSPIVGAVVEVNGKTARTDSEGHYLIDSLKVGKMKVSVKADGYAPHTEEFEILYPGLYRKDFYLTRNRVRLIISILDDYNLQPVKARIKIDGKWFKNDESGVAVIEVDEGEHKIEIVPLSDRYKAKSLTIRASGKTQVEKITLIPVKINLGDLKFGSGSYEINESMQEKLQMACNVLKRYPQARVIVEGHTDTRGSEEYNLNLSRKRAEAVKNWLVENGCVSPEKIKAVGYGESRPLVYPERGPEDFAKNRRVILRMEIP